MYCRTDLCPNCSTKLDMEVSSKDWHSDIILDYPMFMVYKSKVYYTIKCEGCPSLWTKQEVIEYWANYIKMVNETQETKNDG